MSVDPRDFISSGGIVSDCCGANILGFDICQDCGEHCEPVDENEPEPDYDAPKAMTPLENWQKNDEHNVP